MSPRLSVKYARSASRIDPVRRRIRRLGRRETTGGPISTVEEMVQFIRQAEDGSFVMGDDFIFRFSAHFTYNGNGDLTASFSDLTTECR